MNIETLVDELVRLNIIQTNKTQLVNPNAERKLLKTKRYDIIDAISQFTSFIESMKDSKLSLKIMVIYKYRFVSPNDVPVCKNTSCDNQVKVVSGPDRIMGEFCSRPCSLNHRNTTSKITIDEQTGLSVSKLNSLKSRNTLENTIDDDTGLTLEELRGKSVSLTLNTQTSNGNTIAQERAVKEAERRLLTIDPITNKSLRQIYGERSYQKNLANGHYLTVGQKIKDFYATDEGKLIKKEQTKKQRSTLIGKSSVKSLDYSEKKRYRLYRNRVWYYTNKNSKDVENIELRSSNQLKDDAHHIDHKFSIAMGFELNIPPYILGSLHNLQMLHWRDNIEKGPKCSITLECLLQNH